MWQESLTTKLITDFNAKDIRENFCSFNCDNSSLSSYLYRSSYFDSLDFVNSTSVLVNGTGTIRGYFTLRQDKLKVNDLEYGHSELKDLLSVKQFNLKVQVQE